MVIPRPTALPGRPTLARTILALALALAAGAGRAQSADDRRIADHLAEMLRSARTVISDEQPHINDPSAVNKGLDGHSVLRKSVALFQHRTGLNPWAINPASREGRLLRAEMQSIVDVMDSNQTTINREGVGFKGFIPAVFARLVDEAFAKRAGDEAAIKVTAPLDLVRNRRARPDSLEADVIANKFLSPGWKTGEPYYTTVEDKGKKVFRMMVPEYYKASCLSCHGGPKGELDITGYQKEGRNEADLSGVISLTLRH